MSESTIKALRDARREIEWLKGKLNLAAVFGLPLPIEGGSALLITILRHERSDRYAIVRHRPMGAQVRIGDTWVDMHQIPAEAFAYDIVEAHRLSDQLAAEEADEHHQWQARHDAEQHTGAGELAGAVSA